MNLLFQRKNPLHIKCASVNSLLMLVKFVHCAISVSTAFLVFFSLILFHIQIFCVNRVLMFILIVILCPLCGHIIICILICLRLNICIFSSLVLIISMWLFLFFSINNINMFYLFEVLFPRWSEWVTAMTQLSQLPDYFLERCNQFVGCPTPFKYTISLSTELCCHWVLSFIFISAMQIEYRIWIKGEDLWDEGKKQNCAEAKINAPSGMKWIRFIFYGHLFLGRW